MPTEKSRTVTTEMQPDGTLVCVEDVKVDDRTLKGLSFTAKLVVDFDAERFAEHLQRRISERIREILSTYKKIQYTDDPMRDPAGVLVGAAEELQRRAQDPAEQERYREFAFGTPRACTPEEVQAVAKKIWTTTEDLEPEVWSFKRVAGVPDPEGPRLTDIVKITVSNPTVTALVESSPNLRDLAKRVGEVVDKFAAAGIIEAPELRATFQGVSIPCTPVSADYISHETWPEDDPRRGRVLTAAVCDRWAPCGKADCVKCFPGKILPPEKRGSKKPGGNQKALVRARERAKVLGYRVCLCDEDQPGVYTIDPQNGEAFSTPDAARERARKLAKEKGESVYVFHDGQIRWIRRPNGEEEFQAPP